MRFIWGTRQAWAALAVLLIAGSPAAAATIIEIEPNDTFATAQQISGTDFTLDFDPNIGTGSGGGFVNTSTTIPHVTILGTSSTTASNDYFAFTTLLAGIIILDIDSSPLLTNFDTEIHLWDGLGNLLFTNDDRGGDPGDLAAGIGVGGGLNSRIETGVLPAGDYVVGVSAFNSSAHAGGIITGDMVPPDGTYTLHISANAMSVPEPATLVLFGTGLAGAAAFRRRRGRIRTA